MEGANNKYQDNRLFTLNEPHAPRLNPALAAEIGLNESLIFLQLEYFIAISNNVRNGIKWTYQSLTDLKKMFSFLSQATINRAIKSLIEKKLIIVGNFNQKKYDKFSFIYHADQMLENSTNQVKLDCHTSERIG